MPSTVVLRIEYFVNTATLRITFVSGSVYDYEHVSEEVYTAMKTSFSKGIFFNEHIKGKYSFKKISEASA